MKRPSTHNVEPMKNNGKDSNFGTSTILAVFNNTKRLQDCVNNVFINNVFND